MSTYEKTVGILALFVMGIMLPWWVSIPLALYLAAKGVAYELILFGFMLDRLYGVAPSVIAGMELPFEFAAYTFLLLFSAIFFLSIFIKKSLIFYVA